MSDQDNENPQAPSKKTSAVPLKKETVRVTLKADPDQPSAAPTPSAPTAPTAPRPPSAVAPGGAPKPPAPAPTIPLRTAGSPSVPKPAPTIALNTGPAAAGSPTVSLNTTKPAGAPGGQSLPKATVQIDKSQPLPPPSASATVGQTPTISTVSHDEEEEPSDTIPTVLSILSFVLAIVVLGLGISTWLADKTHEVGDLFS